MSKNESWLYKISAAAALIAGLYFLTTIISLIITTLRHGTISPFQDNWLITIFKLHAGYSGVQIALLQGMNFLDIAILAIIGLVQLGLYTALRSTSRVWSIVALVQPFLGIVLFVLTKSAGRSSVMGAALVISIIMLRSSIFDKFIAYTGILASVLLLVGDFGASLAPSTILAVLFGIGYILFIVWLFLIARRLFQLESLERKS
jgi:hypothetical protein